MFSMEGRSGLISFVVVSTGGLILPQLVLGLLILESMNVSILSPSFNKRCITSAAVDFLGFDYHSGYADCVEFH